MSSEYLPPGSSAVVAVVDDQYADKVEAALVNSDKRINKAIDSGDYDELQKAIAKSQDEVSGAITRRSREEGRHTRRPSDPPKGNDDEIHSQIRASSLSQRRWCSSRQAVARAAAARRRRRTSASATETWASGVCSSITTWQAAIKSAAGSVKSDPTKNGLQTAAGDAKSATETLASDLKGLGKPDTPAGQQAQDSLDQLSTSLQQDVTTIENAVKGRLRRERRAHRRPDGDGHIRDDGDGGQDDVHRSPGARREGRAEVRVRELERLQHVDGRCFMSATAVPPTSPAAAKPAAGRYEEDVRQRSCRNLLHGREREGA